MKHNFPNLIKFVLIAVISQSAIAGTQLQIDYSLTHQEIDNFGASDAWSINPLIKKWQSEGKQDEIEQLADYLFSVESGIGLSAWRFNIGAGSSEQGTASNISDSNRRAELLFSSANASVDATKQLGQIAFLQEAHERGVTDFVAFVNSPPVWATKNGLAHPNDGSGVGSTNLADDQLENFAEFLTKVVGYLRGPLVNVPVNHLSPINEPTWSWQGKTQEGNRYNVEDMKAVYLATYNALQEAGLSDDVKLDGAEVVEYTAALSDDYKIEFNGSTYSGGMNGEGEGSYKNYIDEFLGDSEQREILGNKLSMHGYFSDAWADRMGELRDITWENVNEASPGAKLWMSEVCILGDSGNVREFTGSGWDVSDMEYALHVGKMLHRDLTRLNVSGWHWWLGVTPYNYKDGLLKIDSSFDADTLQTSKVLWSLGQFSRFIRPGYLRIDLPDIDDLEGLMASAYRSPDNSRLIVVIINADESEQMVSLEINDLPNNIDLEEFDIYTTSNAHDLEHTGSITSNSEVNISAQSITTLVADLTVTSNLIELPNTVEAENYSSYFDTSSGNQGSALYNDDVDIQHTEDIQGEYNIGWIDDGEWLAYQVNVPSSGYYQIDLRVAAKSDGGSLKVQFADEDKTALIDITSTGGWQNWETITLAQATYLQAGEQEMRIQVENGGFNINYLEVSTAEQKQNISIGKSTEQSSMGWSGDSSRAVDANTNGQYSHNSVTHTLSEAEAWWQVDLGELYDIETINIWNRTDCCTSRLSEYYVLVSDHAFDSDDLAISKTQTNVKAFYFDSTAGSPTQLVANTSGRYVRVQLVGNNPLSLAEVEVFGTTATRLAESSADDGNIATNVLDNNLDTRWSAQGEGQWLELDIGQVQKIKGVEIAFFRGDQRTSQFSIEISDDGNNWSSVINNAESAGNSLMLEAFTFDTINARYIRYVGNGNSSNNWNSLTEFAVITE